MATTVGVARRDVARQLAGRSGPRSLFVLWPLVLSVMLSIRTSPRKRDALVALGVVVERTWSITA